MSYILDALKRSEQERHQSELNHTTIDTIMMPRNQAKHHWWPYILITVLFLNVLVFLYFQYISNTSEAINNEVNSTSTPNDITKQLPEDKLRQVARQPKAVDQISLTGNPSIRQQLSEKPLPEHLMHTPKLVKRYDIDRLNKSNQAQEVEKITLNDDGYEVIRPKNYADNSVPPLPISKPEIKAPVNIAIEQTNYPLRNDEVISQNSKSIEAPIIKQNNKMNFEMISHINDMALAFQKQIPDIKFNSHIYSINPADRRVMINDLYLREGQDFSGVIIEEIGEFYVILSKRSERFKVPVLRDWYSPS